MEKSFPGTFTFKLICRDKCPIYCLGLLSEKCRNDSCASEYKPSLLNNPPAPKTKMNCLLHRKIKSSDTVQHDDEKNILFDETAPLPPRSSASRLLQISSSLERNCSIIIMARSKATTLVENRGGKNKVPRNSGRYFKTPSFRLKHQLFQKSPKKRKDGHPSSESATVKTHRISPPNTQPDKKLTGTTRNERQAPSVAPPTTNVPSTPGPKNNADEDNSLISENRVQIREIPEPVTILSTPEDPKLSSVTLRCRNITGARAIGSKDSKRQVRLVKVKSGPYEGFVGTYRGPVVPFYRLLRSGKRYSVIFSTQSEHSFRVLIDSVASNSFRVYNSGWGVR